MSIALCNWEYLVKYWSKSNGSMSFDKFTGYTLCSLETVTGFDNYSRNVDKWNVACDCVENSINLTKRNN